MKWVNFKSLFLTAKWVKIQSLLTGMQLRELNGYYLVSSPTFKALVPEIEQLVKDGKLEAKYIELEDFGKFALSFRKQSGDL